MKSEYKILKYKKINDKYNIFFYNIIFFLTILIFFMSSFILNKKNNIKFSNLNVTELIESEANFDKKICNIIKRKLKNRKQPFDYEGELSFIISLILCKIPFSFIRFGDGEEHIMSGKPFNTSRDKWYWNNKNKNFQKNLIKSSSICSIPNNFVAIPCEKWHTIAESILSFSKCTNSKYMSYASVFINKNFEFFQNWIVKFINSSNRWKIVLVANYLINKDISWAYRYIPIPEHIVENWDKIRISLLHKLEKEAKKNDLIFFVSAGPAANIIISYLIKINNKNIYIDLGSAIEIITKGFSTRFYTKNGKKSLSRCSSFHLENQIPIYHE